MQGPNVAQHVARPTFTSTGSELFQLPSTCTPPSRPCVRSPAAWNRSRSASPSWYLRSKPSQRGPPGQCAAVPLPVSWPQRLVLGLCFWVSIAWQPHALYLAIWLLRTGSPAGRKRRQPEGAWSHGPGRATQQRPTTYSCANRHSGGSCSPAPAGGGETDTPGAGKATGLG